MTRLLLDLLLFGCCLWRVLDGAIVMERMDCWHDGHICYNKTCAHQLSRGKVPLLSFGCYYPQPLARPIGKITVCRMAANGQLEAPIFDVEENICKLLSHSSRNALLVRLFESFSIKTFKCPLLGHAAVEKMPLNLNGLTQLFANAKYMIRCVLRSNSQAFFDVNVTFSFKSGRL